MTFVLCFRQSSLYVQIYFPAKVCSVGDGEPWGAHVSGEFGPCHQINAIFCLDVARDASRQNDPLSVNVCTHGAPQTQMHAVLGLDAPEYTAVNAHTRVTLEISVNDEIWTNDRVSQTPYTSSNSARR